VLDRRPLDGHREFRHGARQLGHGIGAEFGDGQPSRFSKAGTCAHDPVPAKGKAGIVPKGGLIINSIPVNGFEEQERPRVSNLL
jgi:hypothetical protein